MMLRMNGCGEGSDYGSYQYAEDAEDDCEEELAHHLRVHDHEHPGGVDGDGEDNVESEGEGKGEDEGEDELSEVRKWSQSTRMTRLTRESFRTLRKVADVQFCFCFVGRAVEHVEDHISDAQVDDSCNLQHKRYARWQHRTICNLSRGI